MLLYRKHKLVWRGITGKMDGIKKLVGYCHTCHKAVKPSGVKDVVYTEDKVFRNKFCFLLSNSRTIYNFQSWVFWIFCCCCCICRAGALLTFEQGKRQKALFLKPKQIFSFVRGRAAAGQGIDNGALHPQLSG